VHSRSISSKISFFLPRQHYHVVLDVELRDFGEKAQRDLENYNKYQYVSNIRAKLAAAGQNGLFDRRAGARRFGPLHYQRKVRRPADAGFA